MKNIQVIDAAENCTFPIFQATEVEFVAVFPVTGQDIQFAEDLDNRAHQLLTAVWDRPIAKSDAVGVHGTLFYGFEGKRRHFPATKRERDWNPLFLNEAERRMRGS